MCYRGLSFEAAALTHASAMVALKSRGFIDQRDHQERFSVSSPIRHLDDQSVLLRIS
jgi:hypothetical protein